MNRLALLAVTAVSILSSGPVFSQVCSTPQGGPETCTYHGITFTADQVKRFAPEVQFHFDESYWPVSIEELLIESRLLKVTNGHAEVWRVNPSQHDLATHYQWDDATGNGYRLSLRSKIRGQYPQPTTRRITAPMYVSVQVPVDRSYVELNYIMLYGYNGGQTMRGLRLGDHFNFVIPTLAEHEGDFESVGVRVTPDFQRVLAVRYEAHGNSRYFWPEQVTFVADPVTGQPTHPIASAAMNSHATYNPTGYCPQDWEYLSELDGVAGVIDLFGKDFSLGACGDPNPKISGKWRPWESPASVRLVGLSNGEPVNGEMWVKFQGRVGDPQTNDVTGYGGIGGSLSADELLYIGTLDYLTDGVRKLARLFGGLKDIYEANGPLGLGGRDIVDTRAHNSSPYYLRSALTNAVTNTQNLRLAEVPDASGNRYTVQPADSCRVSQVWDVTVWPGSTHNTAGHAGYALANRASRQLVVTGGDFRSLVPRDFSLATLRTDSLWLAAGYWLIPSQHPSQHMNVFGNDYRQNPGAAVGTWDGGLCVPSGLNGFFCPNSSWFLEAAPCGRPTSSIRIEGTRDSTGVYRGAVTITLTAQSHTEGATAGLRYKLDDAADYEVYNGPLVLTEEGPRTISYYAVDTKGNTEASANSISITIRPTSAPGASTLSSPTGRIRALTPTFTFARVPGASEYELWLKRGETMVFDTWYSWKAVCPGVSSVCTVTPTMALTSGTHTWWIRARNSVGIGPWSPGLGFEAIGPAVVSPRGSISTPSPTFVWNSVAGATEYVLSIEHHNTETTTKIVVPATACSGGNCSTTPAKTLLAGYYRFWVQGRNALGHGAWSTEMAFSVGFDTLAATVLGPAGKTNDPTPTYSWKEVPGAVEYQLWVTNVDGEQTVVKELHPSAACTSGVCSVTPATALAAGEHHVWIFTRFSTGPGLWSALMSFTRVP